MAPSFFGYYGNGYTNWGDVIDNTKQESNLNWLNADFMLESQLQRTISYGQSAIVNVLNLCFKYPSTDLQDDWQLKLSEWWMSVPPHLAQAILHWQSPTSRSERTTSTSTIRPRRCMLG